MRFNDFSTFPVIFLGARGKLGELLGSKKIINKRFKYLGLCASNSASFLVGGLEGESALVVNLYRCS